MHKDSKFQPTSIPRTFCTISLSLCVYVWINRDGGCYAAVKLNWFVYVLCAHNLYIHTFIYESICSKQKWMCVCCVCGGAAHISHRGVGALNVMPRARTFLLMNNDGQCSAMIFFFHIGWSVPVFACCVLALVNSATTPHPPSSLNVPTFVEFAHIVGMLPNDLQITQRAFFAHTLI